MNTNHFLHLMNTISYTFSYLLYYF